MQLETYRCHLMLVCCKCMYKYEIYVQILSHYLITDNLFFKGELIFGTSFVSTVKGEEKEKHYSIIANFISVRIYMHYR